jgi:hypothetical protein
MSRKLGQTERSVIELISTHFGPSLCAEKIDFITVIDWLEIAARRQTSENVLIYFFLSISLSLSVCLSFSLAFRHAHRL